MQQLVNSLQRLNTALATKQTQIVQLVDSSSKVFHAFASEDGNISRALVDLPGTLQQTTQTLQKVTTFAKLLGPTSRNLLPAARSLPAANAALVALAKPSTPIVRDQIRPFVIAARPLVRNLRPAAINLSAATPNLSNTFNVVNHLVNMLGYNPGNTEHGYLWWLAWLDHNIRTLFSVQDANGVFRPLFLQASCASLTQTAAGIAGSSLLLNLAPILSDAQLCPRDRAAGHWAPGHPAGLGPAAPLSRAAPPHRQPRASTRGLMETGSPSITKIVTMVLFALSCVGLLLFLWLSFGGTIPFNPQGYRIRVAFPEASQLADQADVRIAGVSVGKVIGKSLDPKGNRTIATIQLNNAFAPIHATRMRSCVRRRSSARPTCS